MNRPEHELAGKLVQHLDYGVDRLEPGVRQRLSTARNAALSKYREQPDPVFGLAWAGQLARIADHHSFGARSLATVAALALALAGVAWWQSSAPPGGELAEIDTSLLTDELPVNAYLDKGFDSWLKRSLR